MAEETSYSSAPHYSTTAPEITGKHLILQPTSPLSNVHNDGTLVGSDQVGVLDCDSEVSDAKVQKNSDSFVGSYEVSNSTNFECSGEIPKKMVDSDDLSEICMNLKEKNVTFEGSNDLNMNIFEVQQPGSAETGRKSVDLNETGQVFEPSLLKEEVGFERNEEINEFLEMKDEVGMTRRENSSEIVHLGSCGSQSGANSEVTSFMSKSDKRGLSKTGVPATVMKVQMIDDTVVLDLWELERESNGNGAEKIKYSRKELEKLRFVGGKERQKKVWQDVYNGFSEDVKKEYAELSSFKHKKRGGSASHRGILGDSSSRKMSSDAELNSPAHSTTFDGDSNTKHGDDLMVEWSEDDESDDEYQSIRRPAFMVEGEPDFESGPPEDGLEYLRRVRWEAARIPKVKVAKVDQSKLKEQSAYMPKIPDIEKCPPHLAPLKEWEDEFIAEFSTLRMALSHLVDNSDAASVESETMIFCRPECNRQTAECPTSLELPTGGPTLSTLLAMDPATRVALLNKRISLFESATSLSKDDCDWLFALCAVIDTPLHADTSASLRCLLRRCAKLRAEKSELDEEVIMLNILATIAGKCFGQGEY